MPRKTELLLINAPGALERAAAVVEGGGLVIFPTDTLYGIACSPTNPKVLRALYFAKERPEEKAIPVLMAQASQLISMVHKPSMKVNALMLRYWPGALTIVLRKRSGLPKELTPYPTLALRVPAYAPARSLLTLTGPLAVTSANISGQANPISGQAAYDQMQGRVDLVLDGGELKLAQASTIVDCSQVEPRLLREGPIPFTDILETWKNA